MDILAHGLWGGLAFGRDSREDYWGAFAAGVFPDAVVFGPRFAVWMVEGFPKWPRRGPPPASAFPPYTHQAYHVTHSLVVWAAVFLLVWAWRRRPPKILGAWALHILCDIPTHELRFFPTPYLWPFPTPYVNGIRWSQPWFMALNYFALAAAYLLWLWRSKTAKPY